ncbi:MAG: putative bifunctional diguanylate cyclase/phosphodiesterase [Leucobacter sp.]
MTDELLDSSVLDRFPSDPLGEERVRQLVAENVRLDRMLRDLKLGIDSHSIVVFTDPRGIILDCNDKFAELSKYSRDELIGAPQRIVNSGHHPRSFFDELWRTISAGRIWQGTICNRAKDGTEYWVATTILPIFDTEGRIERYLSIRTDVTQLHLAEMRVRKLAYSDLLTGLPNRSLMLSHLSRSAEEEAADSRVYITAEFDDLPMINDAFGFAAGDRFLRRAAERLSDLIYVGPESREHYPLRYKPDLISRVGSAAFGAAFSGLSGGPEEIEAAVLELTRQFSALLEGAIEAELGGSVEPLIRISYVVYEPGGGLDGADVFTRAEIARRRNTRVSHFERPRPVAFEQWMVDEARARADLVLDLRRDVSEGRLRLFLQPVVTAEREIQGYEGLVRWVHPERGIILPGEFIPLAERTGIIVEIGDWVLDEACRILAEWAKHPETRDYTIAVNVSERQLRHDSLARSVRSALHRHGTAPERLKLEVTESELHTDLKRSVDILQELRAERVQISLDDFGTGYSSLNHLNRLPVQQLKIDRSFITSIVENEKDSAIVGTIVQLARQVGLNVVAEGIETEEQFAALQRFDIDAFQGFLFGKPAPLGI